MRKTLATLLAVAFLFLVFSAPLSITSHSMAATSKFQTVANPIPNRFIVVLATTDLSPIATPAPAPKVAAPMSPSASAAALVFDSSSAAVVTELAPDPTVIASANYLTSTYGGTYSLTWSVALKGFRLHATQAQAIAMSGDSQVAFVVQDGPIIVGTPDTDPIGMTPDGAAFQNPQPNASWGLDRIGQRSLPLDKEYSYVNDGTGV